MAFSMFLKADVAKSGGSHLRRPADPAEMPIYLLRADTISSAVDSAD